MSRTIEKRVEFYKPGNWDAGITKRLIVYSWDEIGVMVDKLVYKIKRQKEQYDGVYGIPRGGLILSVCLSNKLNLSFLSKSTKKSLLVDDISETGNTLSQLKYKHIATLFSTSWAIIKPNFYCEEKKNKYDWVLFPWENTNG